MAARRFPKFPTLADLYNIGWDVADPPGGPAQPVPAPAPNDEDAEDSGHVVWRRTGPVQRMKNGMWRRLTGRLKKIIYPSA